MSIPGMGSSEPGKSSASIGEATIIAGETEVTIETTAVKADSKIFVTPTTATDKVLSITETADGEHFKVVITSPSPTDIEFS